MSFEACRTWLDCVGWRSVERAALTKRHGLGRTVARHLAPPAALPWAAHTGVLRHPRRLASGTICRTAVRAPRSLPAEASERRRDSGRPKPRRGSPRSVADSERIAEGVFMLAALICRAASPRRPVRVVRRGACLLACARRGHEPGGFSSRPDSAYGLAPDSHDRAEPAPSAFPVTYRCS